MRGDDDELVVAVPPPPPPPRRRPVMALVAARIACDSIRREDARRCVVSSSRRSRASLGVCVRVSFRMCKQSDKIQPKIGHIHTHARSLARSFVTPSPSNRVWKDMLRRSLYAARRSDLARGARTLATNAPKSGGPAATAAATKKAPAGGEEVDVVKRVFVEQQRKFRALLEKTKTLTPPVGGDAAAVKAYAAKKLAILKEVRRMRAMNGTRARRATVDASVEARSQSKPQRSAIGVTDYVRTVRDARIPRVGGGKLGRRRRKRTRLAVWRPRSDGVRVMISEHD